MPAKKPTGKDLRGSLMQLSASLTKVANRPNLWGYEPHEKQLAFHKSTHRTKLYVGGNRSGKTVGGCVEDIYWLTGKHPHRATPPPPVRGRIVGVDFENGVEKILKPEIARWIPPSELKNGSWEDSYNKTTRTLTLENGSFLEFMSYSQEVDKFAGTSRHFIHFDEEPPESIWPENKARVVDTRGSIWFTLTPVEGMTWIYDTIYEKWEQGTDPLIDVIKVDMTDNPHLSEVEIMEFLSGLDEDDQKARKSGTFVQMGGLAFPKFGKQHIIPEIDVSKILSWRWVCSMDHGFNNPTSWLWHAVSDAGHVITFYEHYMSGWTVSQHAAEVHRINKMFGRGPELIIGDPAIAQRQSTTGHSIQIEYIQHGLPIMLGNNNQRAGVDRMNNYLNRPEPYWLITERCPNLLRQMRRLRWKVRTSAKLRKDNNPYEQLHDKDNHSTDAARYFMTSMPVLAPYKEVDIKEREGKRIVEAILHPTRAVNVNIGVRDENLSQAQPGSTEWTHIEETVGGIW